MHASDAKMSPETPESSKEKARIALEHALKEERHSVGILGEIDGGAVQFEPDPPEVPTDHPELQDEAKRQLDPPKNPPDPTPETEGPGPAEGHTDNKAGG